MLILNFVGNIEGTCDRHDERHVRQAVPQSCRIREILLSGAPILTCLKISYERCGRSAQSEVDAAAFQQNIELWVSATQDNLFRRFPKGFLDEMVRNPYSPDLMIHLCPALVEYLKNPVRFSPETNLLQNLDCRSMYFLNLIAA